MKTENGSLAYSDQRRLLRNINHSTLVQFATLAMSLLFGAYMIRRVGADYFGHITSANAVISICIIFTTFGWPVLLTKIFANGHRATALRALRKSVGDACVITVLTGAVLYVLILLGVLKEPAYPFAFLPLLIFLRSLAALAKAVLDGLGKVVVEQYALGIVLPLLTILCFIFAGTLDSVDSLFVIYSLSALIGLAVLAGIATTAAGPGLDASQAPPAEKRSHNWWLMSAGLSNVVLLNTDIIIMGHYVAEGVIAVYGIISVVVAVMTMAISAGNAIYAPVIVKHYQNNDYRAARIIFRSVQKRVLIWSLPFFLIVSLFPGEIIGALTGNATAPDLAGCLIILAVAQLVNAATGPVATSLYMKGEIAFFASSMMIAVVLNIAGNLWLVPEFGVLGAAVSTAVVIALANVAQYLRARQLHIV
ncbi:hypothetical protein [Pseudomonas neuropathica]|uniref:hypothetical protein n=1 Tax=Pseudomonas neuropathica TaxID=2730425 RepID=UPI003EBE6272